MLIAYIKTDSDSTKDFYIFKNERHYINAMKATAGKTIINKLDLTIHGKTYEDRKNDLQCIANIWATFKAEPHTELSYKALTTIKEHFKTIGKRYGLVKDFRENAII